MLPIVSRISLSGRLPEPVPGGRPLPHIVPAKSARPHYLQPDAPHTPVRRILHVIASLRPEDGGPPEMLRQLARNYRETCVELEVVTLDDPRSSFLDDLDFPILALGPAKGYRYSPRLLRWLKQNMSRFDLTVVNNVWQYPGVAVWLAARELNAPYAVFTHGALDVFFKKRYPMKHLKKSLYWPLQYRILHDAESVLFTSEREREAALASFSPNDYTTTVLPYGTNRPQGEPSKQREAFFKVLPEMQGKRFLLFLGRIHEKKGCDLLVRAFGAVAERWPDLHLVMAGPDQVQWKASLEQQARELGVAERVLWPGMLTGDAKYGAFRAAEAFVLPSHQENFGIAVAEALACGTPVLISDQVNIWKEIAEDRVGLVEPDTYEGTLRLLERWLEMSEIERHGMKVRSEQAFEERFSLRRTAEVLGDLSGYVRMQQASVTYRSASLS